MLKRVDGPTPAGGAYSEVEFFTADGQPATIETAVHVQVREYDSSDRVIATTTAVLTDEEREQHRRDEVAAG